jgi:hypothetical protein
VQTDSFLVLGVEGVYTFLFESCKMGYFVPSYEKTEKTEMKAVNLAADKDKS